MTGIVASGPFVLVALILTSGLLIADLVQHERQPERPVILRYRIASGVATVLTLGLIVYRFYFYVYT